MTNNYQEERTSFDINAYTSQADMYQDLDLPFYYNLGNMLKLEGTFLFLVIISSFLSYLFIAISLQKIARKLKISNDWYAWVPVLNLSLLLKIVNKPQALIFVFLIPVIGILFGITIWMELATTLSKPRWLGALMVIPFVNIFVILYFAYADDSLETNIADVAIIKGSSEAFAYNSKIVVGKESLQTAEQTNNLNQLEKDLQKLETDSPEIQAEIKKETIV